MADGSFNVSVTVDGLPSGGFFASFKRFFNIQLRKAEVDIKKRLLHDAREEHKYTHRSRNLRNATKVKGSILGKNGLELYVDMNQARYGGFIITGERDDPRFGIVKVKSGPDPFIDKAIDNNEQWITKRLQQAINGAIVQFNRTK